MSERVQAERLVVGLETASSNRNLAGALVGECLAILTFLLFFLYDRAKSGEIDASLFQITLLIIVVASFSFGFSGLYYYNLMVSLSTGHPAARTNLQRADVSLVLGIVLLVLEPALIMFTLNMMIVGFVALIFWSAYVYFTLTEAKRRRYEVFRPP